MTYGQMAAGARITARGARPYSALMYREMKQIPPPLPSGRSGNSAVGLGEGEGAAVAATVGIGVGAIALTILAYLGIAYVVGWGASKGWQKAKKR